MQVIKLLPGQTVLDSNGQEILVEDFDSLVCFYDEEKEEALDKLYDQYGEDYINSQLEKGMQVEREHSDDREMQYSMARDHILEFVDYYEYLEDMEAEMEKEGEDALTADVSEDNLLESRKEMRENDQEKNIVWEGSKCYVFETRKGYEVRKNSSSGTYTIVDSTYALGEDGLSLAIARAKYIEKYGKV